MKKVLVTLVVLAVATPVFAAEWYGSADYNANGFITVIGPGAITYTGAISKRFTAKRNVTGVAQVKLNCSGSGYGGTPQGSVSIHSDDGAGNPGAILGAASPVTTLVKNGDTTFLLGGAANLTAGQVYHVKFTNASATTADKARLSTMGVPTGGQTNQKVEWGMGSTMGTDANMAGLFYLQGDPVYPDGWYEGRPAEFTKHWEPYFGLYDQAGTQLNDGEGAKSGYDRAQINKHYGTSFVLQNVPAAYVSGGLVEIGRVRVNSKAIGGASLTDNLKISLRAAGGTEIASGVVLRNDVVAGWNDVLINVNLTVGQRYQVVYLTDGTGNSNNVDYYYAENHKTGAVPQGDLYQQMAAYGIQSTDGGTTWTTTQDVEYLFGLYIPEPATLSLLVIGGMAVLARKRR
jgi:hypothetical protein